MKTLADAKPSIATAVEKSETTVAVDPAVADLLGGDYPDYAADGKAARPRITGAMSNCAGTITTPPASVRARPVLQLAQRYVDHIEAAGWHLPRRLFFAGNMPSRSLNLSKIIPLSY